MLNNLLVELLVEELPPKALQTLAESFASSIFEGLKSRELTNASSSSTSFATPRRLAVHITDVLSTAPDKEVLLKLMPAAVAIGADGKPTDALRKRLSKEGRAHLADLWPNASDGPDKLFVQKDGKADAIFLRSMAVGSTLDVGLKLALEEMLKELPVPKEMTYQLADGWETVKFVRPAHGLSALHGSEIVAVSILGLESGRTTKGHRFESKQAMITLKDADSYAQQMDTEGSVIASFVVRREQIVRQLHSAAQKAGLELIRDEALIDEVTSLVERPNVLSCQFEAEYLEVPQECLILTMKANQKYFPLLDSSGKLTNRFLLVSNIRPTDPSRVIEGNERVVRPRLSDAKFFYAQDRKQTLESRRERLKGIVYHNLLGSVFERSERVSKLARRALIEGISGETYNSSSLSHKVQKASELAKADLVTNMVGEFPELQGVMGRYYALADGVDVEVAEAIREQYLPRGAGDELPITPTGMALAIADKLDTIAGVFAINQKPTGAKDPFGLRRAAIGILRIIVERKLSVDLSAVILDAVRLQPPMEAHVKEGWGSPHPALQTKPLDEVLSSEIYDYILERLRGYYLEGNSDVSVTTEMFDAVLANRPASPLDFDRRLRALQAFLKLEDAQSLAAANKRINNILRKSGRESFGEVSKPLLSDAAEKALAEQVELMTKTTEPLFKARDYAQALSKLAGLRPVVDAFFDSVMVMAVDEAIRNNRLALLARLRDLFAQVADLSRLPG